MEVDEVHVSPKNQFRLKTSSTEILNLKDTYLKFSASESSLEAAAAAAAAAAAEELLGCGMMTLDSNSTPSGMVNVSFEVQRTKEKKTFQSSFVLRRVRQGN